MSNEWQDHHERADLNDYERRQLELLEQAFVSEDIPQAPEEAEEQSPAGMSSFCITLLIGSAWSAAVGVVFDIVPLTILSVLGVTIAVLLCCGYRCGSAGRTR